MVIRKLPDDLINKIAAGEVVERPASVVKELVENSLDAGATRIEINIKDGGKKLIQVTDDGCGIPSDQLELAIARHASSKISCFDDLYALKTKGFRGEALASICSVAKVSIASLAQEEEAQEILIEGGQVVDRHACAHAKGTTVTVKYLFYQTPARLKFLKTTETETAHIESVVTKLALCHSQVGFLLRRDSSVLLDLPAQQTEADRVHAVLGADFKDYLFPFSEENPHFKVQGFFGHPQMARSQRSFCFLFVNQRPVTDKVLWHAVMEAYRDTLMRGKFPVLVLQLTMDENLIDVNVHPTKAEVRFHQSQQVHQFIFHCLRKHIQAAPWLSVSSAPAEQSAVFFRESQNKEMPSQPTWDDWLSAKGPLQNTGTEVVSLQNEHTEQHTVSLTKNINFKRIPYGLMQPIGQFLGTYILCEAGQSLFVIDQHAAHERIGFEKLLQDYEHSGLQGELLLIPETFDLKPSDAEILKNYIEELRYFGFELEYFGGHTFVVKARPKSFDGKVKLIQLIQDVIEDIKATGEMGSLKDRYHDILASLACHAQIRASHHLEFPEMVSLLQELDQYQLTDFCPHGRPVCIQISKDEMERWFHRVI